MKYTASHWGAYEIEGDTLRPLASDDNPSRVGKGWVSAVRDTQSRILRPSIRQGWLEGDKGAARSGDSFVEVSWDEAARLVASEITRIRDAHGNSAIFGGSYGWSSAGRFHHAQSQMRRFLNLCGGFTFSRDTYSHAAAEVFWPWVTGLTNGQMQDAMTTWPQIRDNATMLVAFGGISPRTAQISSAGTTRHEVATELGQLNARVVNVSPLKSDLEGAEWLSIRPGTDLSLMLALCHTLLIEGLHDEAFLARYTSGWDRFRASLLGEDGTPAKTADWAAPLCGIPADNIRALARSMAANRTMVTLTWGMQRVHRGEQILWAGLALAALIGQIGQPGCGFGFGYGSVSAVGRAAPWLSWPSVPQGKNEVADFIPVARISDLLETPGGTFTYNGRTHTYPETKLVYWTGGNPFHHHQDLNRLDAAWRAPETVIINDHSWTATARRGDIVLPATSPLERSDLMINRRDPTLLYMSRMFEPLGEALDDHEIFRRIAVKMGLEDAFTEGRSTDQWVEHIWNGCRKVGAASGIDVPDFATLKTEGRVDLPVDEVRRDLFSDFIADPDGAPLRTETGRIVLASDKIDALGLRDCPGLPTWEPPVESLLDAPDGALHLISNQPDTRLHGQNDRGSESLASKIEGREVCRMHPEAAAARGITEGSVIRLWNNRGACLAGVQFQLDMRDDCVVLPTGAWFDPQTIDGEPLEVHGNPNVLTLDIGASGLSQGNIGHTTVVWAEPWTKPLPPLSIDKPPRFVDAPPKTT